MPFQQFELENGLDVIFHIDRSDPVVAVSLTAHVGSGRERPGRTGFAHLFEHLLFLESENLGKGGLDAMSARIGGSGANGSTSRDWTNYFQTVPNNALEKMIWAEADKLGWFINTVTDPVLAKEKQVVKNEKRQSVDNQPYGHLFSVLRSNMYPETHPYHWEVIGSLEDVQAATLDDVKTFYRAWYTPNNVTLVVAGDFDASQAREWVETYFSEIPRGPDIEARAPQPAVLEDSLSFVHEDSFAEQPLIAMAWPTVPEYHPDSYPLAVLADLLSEGKRAPLNEVLIDEAQQTAAVTVFTPHNELAGEFITIITAFEDIDLDDVKASLEAGFDRFETDGVSAAALDRVKIAQEVDFYRGLQSVLGKSINLAQYSIFTGDPGYADAELAALRAVTAEDVMRVYETYVKDQAYVAASFVPKGSPQLALNGAQPANVTEEQILADAEDDFDPNIEATYEPTPSVIDRSVEPPAGPTPVLATPDIWETELENGMKVLGIEDDELPIVEFVISIDGGHLADSVAQNGRANFVAEMLTRGTKTKTPAELQEAISDLGAEITASVSDEAILVRGRALARNFDPVMDLLTEIMTEPRWDGEEFDLAKSLILNEIVGLKANPGALAQLASAYTRYGADDIRAHSTFGSQTSVEALTLEDLKAFHGKYIVPHLASFRVVGDISEAEVRASLGDLEATWARTDLEPITVTRPLLPSEP
ncbi:MAG: pitrilysin family protein, partial [Pseudomonadota bacterium]